MKIRPGQPLRPQKNISSNTGAADKGRFQVLLNGELESAIEKQPASTPGNSTSGHRRHQLLNDASRLLDEAIEQIEANDAPCQKTVDSLQALRVKLKALGSASNETTAADTILAVEAERLKSW